MLLLLAHFTAHLITHSPPSKIKNTIILKVNILKISEYYIEEALLDNKLL